MLLDKENELTQKIIGCCFKAHNILGAGFDEKIYHRALIEILKSSSINFQREQTYPIYFEKTKIASKRLDLIIENKVIMEIKSIKGYLPDIYKRQLISYLKLTNISVGLLVNFGNSRCTVKRYLNDEPSVSSVNIRAIQ